MDKHNFMWFVCGTSQLSWQPEKVCEREKKFGKTASETMGNRKTRDSLSTELVYSGERRVSVCSHVCARKKARVFTLDIVWTFREGCLYTPREVHASVPKRGDVHVTGVVWVLSRHGCAA